MRILMILAVLASLVWGGYWFIGARAVRQNLETLIAETPELSVAELTVQGFPNRFDVTFDAPRIATNGIEWTTPFAQLFALSYQPNHLIAVFAHDQRVRTADIDLAIHTEDLRTSVVMQPTLDLPLERIVLVGQEVTLSLADETHSIGALRLASRAITEHEHDIALLMDAVRPDPGWMNRFDPQAIWPRFFDILRVDAQIEVDAPLDRHALTGQPPRITRFSLIGAQAEFDTVSIVVHGRLTPDAEGLLSGEFSLTVDGWRDLMQRARDAGLMPEQHDALVEMAMAGLVDPDDPNHLETAFAVNRGEVRLGPILVGRLAPISLPRF